MAISSSPSAFIGYSDALLALASALFILGLIYSIRKRWRAQPQGLQSLFRRNPGKRKEAYHDLIMPLMIYEEAYPAFGEILAAVLDRFSLDHFRRDPEFETALKYLADSALSKRREDAVVAAMSTIVKLFLADPEVEYRCRPELGALIDRFLKEIESE